MEEWKYIKGYEGLYQVSNHGRVRSFTKHKDGFILNPLDNGFGYFRVALWDKDGHEKRHRVNRLVAFAFVQNHGNYQEVNHINGDKKNNMATNLEWCNHSQNMQHSFKLHPYQQRGENNSTNKLTSVQVLEIYSLAHRHKRQGKEIAAMYRISNVTVSAIKTGKIWRHLTQDEEIRA